MLKIVGNTFNTGSTISKKKTNELVITCKSRGKEEKYLLDLLWSLD